MENNLQVQTYNMDLNGTNSTGIVIMECEPSTSQTLPGASNSETNNEQNNIQTQQPDCPNMNIIEINYKKLVVPRRMRSPYWKYFGFPATESGLVLLHDKIICILCKRQFAYKGNTQILRRHFQISHKNESAALEKASSKGQHDENDFILLAESEGKVEINNLKLEELGIRDVINDEIIEENVTNNIEQNETPQLPPYDMISDVVSDTISEFEMTDLQVRVEENNDIKPICEFPENYELNQDIKPKLYETTRDYLLNRFSSGYETFALGIEEWICANLKFNITINVFFQQLDSKELCTKQLDTIMYKPNTTFEEWNRMLSSLFINWNINPNDVKPVIKAFTNCNLEQALLAQGFVIIPCLVYELQNLCTTYCFEIEKVVNVLTKCRIISKTIRESGVLTEIFNMPGNQDYNLFHYREYPQIWLSTYNYLELFYQNKHNIETLCTHLALQYVLHEQLTNEDWSIIEDIITTLKPLEVTVTTLSEQQIPLISLLKPLINQILFLHFKVKPGDSKFTAGLKKTLSNVLHLKYNDIKVQIFLHISTLLDPRFKDMPMFKEEYHPSIKQELVKMIENEKCLPCGSIINTPEFNTNLLGNNRITGIEFLLGNITVRSAVTDLNKMSFDDQMNLEIALYESEPTPTLQECPIVWWSRMSSKCPNLIRLARKHLLYALSAPSSKLPLDLQILHSKNRSKIVNV